LSYASIRAEGLKKQAEGVIAEQNKLIALQKSAIRDQLEKQHGLLAFGLATGNALGPEAALLHDTISDYLNAKTEADAEAAHRSAELLWKHGCIIPGEPGPEATGSAIVSDFETIEDPEARSAYYKKHPNELLGGGVMDDKD
jgi:hypothetical protein